MHGKDEAAKIYTVYLQQPLPTVTQGLHKTPPAAVSDDVERASDLHWHQARTATLAEVDRDAHQKTAALNHLRSYTGMTPEARTKFSRTYCPIELLETLKDTNADRDAGHSHTLSQTIEFLKTASNAADCHGRRILQRANVLHGFYSNPCDDKAMIDKTTASILKRKPDDYVRDRDVCCTFRFTDDAKPDAVGPPFEQFLRALEKAEQTSAAEDDSIMPIVTAASRALEEDHTQRQHGHFLSNAALDRAFSGYFLVPTIQKNSGPTRDLRLQLDAARAARRTTAQQRALPVAPVATYNQADAALANAIFTIDGEANCTNCQCAKPATPGHNALTCPFPREAFTNSRQRNAAIKHFGKASAIGCVQELALRAWVTASEGRIKPPFRFK